VIEDDAATSLLLAEVVTVTGVSAGLVMVTDVGLAPQTVHMVTTSVMLMVKWLSVAVAGISLVTSVLLVVKPVGQRSMKVVLMTVVCRSSPWVGTGTETMGTRVVEVAAMVLVPDVIVAGTEAAGVSAGRVRVTVVGFSPQTVHTVTVSVMLMVSSVWDAVTGICLVTSVLLVVNPVGQRST